ncbi:MAG TPA: DMT family transporter [Candidatus Dependentiae bacterium]|jgi:drug/metabolite transporter (DMT)-like permease|nr:DMT family transporter [Candidatus Dependentiae bacterium]
MFLVLLVYFLLSSTFVIGKAALAYSQPIFLIAVRMCLAGIILLAYLYIFNKKQLKFKKEDLGLFAQIILFHIYLSFVLEFLAYKYVSASKAAFMFNLSPFVTALFAYMFFKERMTGRQWIGMLLGFAGTLPMLMGPGQAAEQAAMHIGFLSLPEISLLGSVVAASYGWIVMTKLVVNKHYSPIFVNGIGMLCGGFAAFITSFAFEAKPLLKCALQSTTFSAIEQTLGATWFCCTMSDFLIFMGYVLLLILVANIIFYNSYGFLLKKYTPTFLSLVGLLCPLFTAFLGWLFLGEKVTWIFFVSLAVVLLGAYIFYKDELRGSTEQ